MPCRAVESLEMLPHLRQVDETVCQSALNRGALSVCKRSSESHLVRSARTVHTASTRHARKRSSLARPCLCLLTLLSLVIRPAVWPFDQGSVWHLQLRRLWQPWPSADDRTNQLVERGKSYLNHDAPILRKVRRSAGHKI